MFKYGKRVIDEDVVERVLLKSLWNLLEQFQNFFNLICYQIFSEK